MVERVHDREDKADYNAKSHNIDSAHRRCVLYWFINWEQIAHLSRLLSHLRVYIERASE